MILRYTPLLFLLSVGQSINAQTGSNFPDTLITEPVIGNPIALMAKVPSGADDVWVNYDADMGEGLCASDGDTTPLGWYIERDFSFLNPDDTENDAFTSCSYLAGNGSLRNHNWLILPPIFIPDETYQLCWRSLVSEGPAYSDGYKVLASTASNLPSSGDFSHVLFKAAETIKFLLAGSPTLNVADYQFSEGYIHANGFTDTNYYFLLPPNGPFRGRLEPHCVSLAAFSGQSIYIAFHHDSKDDSQLQVDDILVSNDNSVAVKQPGNFLDFNMVPNPANISTFIQWTLKRPEPGHLSLRDLSGRLVLEKDFSAYEQGQVFLDLKSFAPGVYACTLQTASGLASRRLVKM